jgi:hypothetical protein
MASASLPSVSRVTFSASLASYSTPIMSASRWNSARRLALARVVSLARATQSARISASLRSAFQFSK